MMLTVKLILILFGLAYLISPVDIIPDLLLPWVGWIDDSLVLWCVYYLIRHGELPWFLFNRPQKPRPVKPGPSGPGRKTAGRAAAGHTSPKKESSHRQNSSGARQTNNGPRGQSKASAYQILGVDPRAPWEEIQGAYKEKIKQYHPDKLSHLGEEFSSLANEKFLEIQAAYNQLRAIRKKS